MQDILTQIYGTTLGPGSYVSGSAKKNTQSILRTPPGATYEEVSYKAASTYTPPVESQPEMAVVPDMGGIVPGTGFTPPGPPQPPYGFFRYTNNTTTYFDVSSSQEYFITGSQP